jgi:hypothetical protein
MCAARIAAADSASDRFPAGSRANVFANLGNFIIGDFIGSNYVWGEYWGGSGIPILQMCDFYNKITLKVPGMQPLPGHERQDYCPNDKSVQVEAMELLRSQLS